MEFTVRVNVKAVLAVVAVGALCVGSFYAGEWHQAHREQAPIDLTDGLVPKTAVPSTFSVKNGSFVIPPGIHKETWCASHPETNWKYSTAGVNPSDGFVPDSGICDEKGQAITWDPMPTK